MVNLSSKPAVPLHWLMIMLQTSDSLLDGTDDGLVKLSIAAGAGDNNFALKYVNAKRECFVYAQGKSVKLGHITEDGFSPVSNAQAFNNSRIGNITNNSNSAVNRPTNVSVGLSATGVSVPVKTIVNNGDVASGVNSGNVTF